MTKPTFGLSIQSVDNEPRPAITADLSTIGLVVTAPLADAGAFPLNTPVLINSADDATVALLGTTGSVANQIALINAQLDGFNSSARIVIVRVDEGVDDDATITNLVAGLEFLKDAATELGVTPRLIGVPGYTHQQAAPATANPVVAALDPVLDSLFGVAVVTGPHDSLANFTDWRGTINSRRIIPVETWVNVGAGPDTVDSVGAVLGLAVARDAANGGVPSKSWANRAIQGIVAPNRNIPFNITDGALEGQQILALNGGIIVRGEAGSATSLGTGGFTFVGTDTASDDALWTFYNVVRMRDFIHLMFLKTLRGYLGKFNLTTQTIEAILNTMKFALRDLKADGDLLGYQVGFNPDQNSPEELRLGNFTVFFKAEEPPVLRQLEIESFRYREALDALVSDLIAAA